MARKRKRGCKTQDFEDKIGRKLLRMVPELPNLFRRLFDRVERFDGTEPRTFLAGMEHDCNVIAEKLRRRGPRVGRFLWFLMGKLASAARAKKKFLETVEFIKRAAAEDERYSLLLKLMHKADESVPHGSLFVSFMYADQKGMIVPQSVPLKLLQQAEETSGEARAAAVLDALAKTAEFLYKPYVQTVWALSYVKEGKPLPKAPEFGDLVRVTHERLSDYPGLVEPDAGWMRNSAVHNLPDYVPEEDSLWMWDRNHPRTMVRVDDLLELVQRMYLISAVTIQRVGQLYLLREFYLNTGLLDMFVGCIPHIFSGDEKRLSEAEQEMEEYAKALIAPMEKYFDSQSRPASA
jgi:hypothetical protein